MNFLSDNTAHAAPEIIEALLSSNDGAAAPYGEDRWSRRLDEAFSELFETEVRVFTVASGTAANALSLATLAPPWGAIVCHEEAHIAVDEAGAPEFFTGGAKLLLAPGAEAKLSPQALAATLARCSPSVHAVQPKALSISQTTERGAVYAPAEVEALAEMARSKGLGVHMDGARFANAVAALGCAPGDITWRAGVDLLSFGATKNGALGAEAIVAFGAAPTEEIERRRKRAGHLICKGRYVAAQLLAYVENGLWLRLAARANALAQRLGEAAAPLLSAPVASNQVFIRPGPANSQKLKAAGVHFYDWGVDEARLVVSWSHTEAEVAAMAALLASLELPST